MSSAAVPRIALLCERQTDAWRVSTATVLPPRLAPLFDEESFECTVFELDFEYLKALAGNKKVLVSIQRLTDGDVAVSARGDAALVVATWLAMAFSSGVNKLEV